MHHYSFLLPAHSSWENTNPSNCSGCPRPHSRLSYQSSLLAGINWDCCNILCNTSNVSHWTKGGAVFFKSSTLYTVTSPSSPVSLKSPPLYLHRGRLSCSHAPYWSKPEAPAAQDHILQQAFCFKRETEQASERKRERVREIERERERERDYKNLW